MPLSPDVSKAAAARPTSSRVQIRCPSLRAPVLVDQRGTHAARIVPANVMLEEDVWYCFYEVLPCLAQLVEPHTVGVQFSHQQHSSVA